MRNNIDYSGAMPELMILLSSLIGSPHCAAMCGGFVALCSQGEVPAKSQSLYHLGRLVTYLILGACAGLLGAAVNSLGAHYGISHIAAAVTGILLILVGIAGIFHIRLRSALSYPTSVVQRIQRRILPDRSRLFLFPFTIGIFSTFLPCGWLYTYVAVAAGRADVLHSMLVMFFFWLGTLPILISVGALSKLFISPLARYMPVIASLLMICAGGFSLYAHFAHRDHGHSCHSTNTEQVHAPTHHHHERGESSQH